MKMSFFIIIGYFAILGCYNHPTPPSDIIGAHFSGLQYQQYDCDTLYDEISFLEKHEKDLIIAQEKRIKESESQQWWAEGGGKGDGIEASELNRVKGEIKAARKVFKDKKCNLNN